MTTADQALYQAKRVGRNCAVRFESLPTTPSHVEDVVIPIARLVA